MQPVCERGQDRLAGLQHTGAVTVVQQTRDANRACPGVDHVLVQRDLEVVAVDGFLPAIRQPVLVLVKLEAGIDEYHLGGERSLRHRSCGSCGRCGLRLGGACPVWYSSNSIRIPVASKASSFGPNSISCSRHSSGDKSVIDAKYVSSAFSPAAFT